jgi:type VI protein secretion system component Hcp
VRPVDSARRAADHRLARKEATVQEHEELHQREETIEDLDVDAEEASAVAGGKVVVGDIKITKPVDKPSTTLGT